jgi:predicted permease
MTGFWRDLLHAMRSLRRHPAFAVTSVSTLALGLAAVTTAWSVVHSVLLRPLPYPGAHRLVSLDHAAPGIGSRGGLDMTPGLYRYYERHARTLEHIAIYTTTSVNLAGDGAPERLEAASVTPTLAHTLGVSPALGRFFDAQDDAVDGNAALILSHALWVRRFGGASDAVGRTVQLDGVTFRIIGVMPRGFAFPFPRASLWIPLRVEPAPATVGSFSYVGIGRIAAGRTAGEVQRELMQLVPGLVDEFADGGGRRLVQNARMVPLVLPLHERLASDAARTLWIVLGTAGLVLLVAGANVLNLTLVRSESRRRESATRLALGAGPGALWRSAAAEHLLIGVTAAVLSLPAVATVLELLRLLGPAALPRREEIGLAAAGAAMTIALGVVASAVLALATRPRRLAVAQALREGGRGLTAGRGRLRWRSALVAGQVALSVVLAVGAGLMVRSVGRLSRVDPGFAAENVLTFEVGLPRAEYANREAAVAAHNAILERVRNLSGVVSAGATTCLPLCGRWAGDAWVAEGRPPAAGENPPVVATRRVSPGYLEALRVSLVAGRTIMRDDETRRSGAAVVSAQLARRLWPGENALGKRLYHGTPDSATPWYTVVGVVSNTPIRDLGENPAPMVFLPLLHGDSTRGPAPWLLSFVVRTTLPPARVVEGVRAAVLAVDPELPLARVQELAAIVRAANARLAFAMLLLVVAASLALALGLLGVYGILAYVVALRAGEFGVRLALGARPRHVVGMVLRSAGTVVGIGLAAGLVGAVWATRVLEALLYGISPGDVPTFVAVVVILAFTGLAVALLPAVRAARTDPVRALRAE